MTPLTQDLTTARNVVEALDAYKRGEFAKTTRLCAELIGQDPRNWLAWYGAGVSAARLREHAVAADLLETALGAMPRPAPPNSNLIESELRYNLARIYHIEGYPHRALRHYERSVELDPTQSSAWGNLGNLWLELCRPLKAMACYNRALAIEPQGANGRFNRAFASLIRGDFATGLADYEARWGMVEHLDKFQRPDITTPVWDGSPTPGTLLLHAEQGRGDQIQILRYLPEVQRRVGRLILEMLPELMTLVGHNFPGVELIARVDPHDPASIPPHDVNLPTMSLLYALGERLETVSGEPYLAPPPGGPVLPPTPGLRVGIAWAGSPHHVDDRKRSINLADWGPLLRVPGVAWYSLQVGEQEDGGLASVSTPIIRSRDTGIATFADAAAVMRQLDLVISVDTATAHLAGALGVPVWILLPVVPDWRWLLDRESTPWYASARLFRARKPLRWDDPIKRVAGALRELIAERERKAA